MCDEPSANVSVTGRYVYWVLSTVSTVECACGVFASNFTCIGAAKFMPAVLVPQLANCAFITVLPTLSLHAYAVALPLLSVFETLGAIIAFGLEEVKFTLAPAIGYPSSFTFAISLSFELSAISTAFSTVRPMLHFRLSYGCACASNVPA